MILDKIHIAPLAGISDSPFRSIQRLFGAKILYSEMISADGLSRSNKNTVKMLNILEEDGPIIVQLFGNKIDSFIKSVNFLNQLDYVTEINLNAGCPVRKVIKAGSGASLLKNLNIIKEILSVFKKYSSKKISLKIRSSWDKDNVVSECIKICEGEGADKLIIHARSAKMVFSGNADWNIIKKAKEEAKKVIIVGNGDISSLSDAKNKIDEGYCDEVMIGRAVFGNPWLLKGEKSILNKSFIEIILKHMDFSKKFYGENAYKLMKKHIIYYMKRVDLKGYKDFDKKQFYDAISRVESFSEELKLVENLCQKL